jgi:hypothetical protein
MTHRAVHADDSPLEQPLLREAVTGIEHIDRDAQGRRTAILQGEDVYTHDGESSTNHVSLDNGCARYSVA